ncbi:MAG: protein translocase subunit SecF [bacterium (Candidatus Stahlbacteria) CG23_combo_of_CG06-09_8_20_14_all_34_7]|nr:MAG: protein translocase subunit SecF [bacterium (Candidatus Stahlbacteria) CG23_combo_of_CG06-09_8_20_14_all_34_7]
MSFLKTKLPEVPFTKNRKYTYILSLILILIGLISMFVKGGLESGIDFTGGIVLQVHFDKEVHIDQLRTAVKDAGYENAMIQKYGTSSDFLIKVQGDYEKDKDTIGPVITEFVTYPNPTAGEKSVALKVRVRDDKSAIKNIFLRSDIYSSVQEVSAIDKYDMLDEYGTITVSVENFTKDTIIDFYIFATDYSDNVGNEKKIQIQISKDKKIDSSVITEWADSTLTKTEAKATVFSPSEKLINNLKEFFSENNIRIDKEEVVGAAMSKELQLKSLWVVLLGMLAILVYVWFRFTFRFGVASVLAIFHDVIITLGFLSLTGREMSIPIIAALLTLIGYSINDSIIVSDRIRENIKLMRKDSYEHIVNRSLNQVLGRTLITSGTTLIVLISLFIFGGTVINNFAFTLIMGIIVGTYSSDFIVAPLVLDWELKYPTKKRG